MDRHLALHVVSGRMNGGQHRVREQLRPPLREPAGPFITVLPVTSSVSGFGEGLGRILKTNAASIRLLDAQGAITLGDLSAAFQSADGPDVALLDCHNARPSAMCRLISRVRLAGWGGPIFVVVNSEALSKIPIAMSLGASEFALITTPVAEIELRLSRLVAADSRDVALTTVELPGGVQLLVNWRVHVVSCADTRVGLTLRELQLFATLIEHVGQTLSSASIARHAWGEGVEPESMVPAYMSSLRKKLAWFGNRFGVRTIRGEGYRFEIPLLEPTIRANGHTTNGHTI
jgi:DNA-binding response OmpR family regulator